MNFKTLFLYLWIALSLFMISCDLPQDTDSKTETENTENSNNEDSDSSDENSNLDNLSDDFDFGNLSFVEYNSTYKTLCFIAENSSSQKSESVEVYFYSTDSSKTLPDSGTYSVVGSCTNSTQVEIYISYHDTIEDHYYYLSGKEGSIIADSVSKTVTLNNVTFGGFIDDPGYHEDLDTEWIYSGSINIE